MNQAVGEAINAPNSFKMKNIRIPLPLAIFVSVHLSTAVSDDTYWKVSIAGANPMFAGCNATLAINGNNKFTSQAVAGGPGGTTFTSSTYGTEDVAIYGGYTGLYFTVTVA